MSSKYYKKCVYYTEKCEYSRSLIDQGMVEYAKPYCELMKQCLTGECRLCALGNFKYHHYND